MKKLVIAFFLLAACSSPKEQKNTVSEQNMPVQETPKSPDQSTIEGFWQVFKEAVLAKNTEKTAQLSLFPCQGVGYLFSDSADATQEDFIKNFDTIFDKESIEQIQKTNLPQKNEDGTYFFDVMYKDEQGESMKRFVFKQIDGKFLFAECQIAG